MDRLVSFTKIENKDQLLKWSQVVRVHSGGSTAQWADLQDVFGHSNGQLMLDLTKDLVGSEREVAFFAIWKCSGEFWFAQVVENWMKARMRKEENRYFSKEIQPLLDSIELRENALEDAKKHIYRKINDLQIRLDQAERRAKHWEAEANDWKTVAWNKRAQLVKLQKVSEAIQTINEFMQNGN
jgi:hypothetical protein